MPILNQASALRRAPSDCSNVTSSKTPCVSSKKGIVEDAPFLDSADTAFFFEAAPSTWVGQASDQAPSNSASASSQLRHCCVWDKEAPARLEEYRYTSC